MAAAGASPDNIARELAKLPADEAADLIELDMADDGLSAVLFLAMDTQWNMAGMSSLRTGLNYLAVKPTAELLGHTLHPQILPDLKIMEAETLKVQAEQLRADNERPRR